LALRRARLADGVHGATVGCARFGVDGADERPGAGSQAACRGNMMAWLEPCDCVLFVGAAKQVWRPDLTVAGTRGQVGLWTDERGGWPRTRIAMVINNPAPGHPNPSVVVGQMIRDMEVWVKVLGEVRDGEYGKIMTRMGRQCCECDEHRMQPVSYIDPDGFGWCKAHAETTYRGYGRKAKVVGKVGGLQRWEAARVTIREDVAAAAKYGAAQPTLGFEL